MGEQNKPQGDEHFLISRPDLCKGMGPPPGDLSNPGIKPASLALAGRYFPAEPPGKWLSKFSCLAIFSSSLSENRFPLVKNQKINVKKKKKSSHRCRKTHGGGKGG